MSLVSDYRDLSSKSSSSDVQKVLNAIINTLQINVSTTDRTDLAKQLLDDLADKSNNSRIHSKSHRQLALAALKTLGRSPDAAQILATKVSLTLLLTLTELSPDVARIMANALLLHAPGRQNFIAVNGPDYAFNLLSSSTDATSLFLACRLLFLCTHDSTSAPFMDRFLKETNILDVTVAKMDLLTKKVISGTETIARDGLGDLFKYSYNFMLHYSRYSPTLQHRDTSDHNDPNPVMGESWNDKFSVWVSPLLRSFSSLPNSTSPPSPLSVPLTHCMHCLLAIPVEPYQSTWLPTSPTSSRSNSFTNRAKSFFSSSRSSSPAPGSNRGSRSSSPKDGNDTKDDYVLRCYELVKTCLEYYFPGSDEVDSAENRERAKSEDVILDDLLSPLVLLLRKMAEGEGGSKGRIRNWILPDNLDRTSPLESRSDVLGKLVRLMSSVYHARLGNCAGELIFAMCDNDSSQMSAMIGYGNAAGYLFNKGILSAPPPPSNGRTNSGRPSVRDDVNPITGTVIPETRNPLEDMTEEEKEREAEKLFVLFDRLEKKGLAENPIRKAQQEGKLEKYK